MGCLNYLIGIIWAVLVALKVAGVGTIANASWFAVIFWPVIPILIMFVILVIFAVLAS